MEGSKGFAGRSLGLLAMLGYSFCIAAAALQVKYLPEFRTFALLFWRSLFTMAGTLAIQGYRRENPIGASRDWGFLLVRGLAGFGVVGALYKAVRATTLSNAIAILNTSPVITGIAAAVFLGEPWGILDIMGCLVSFCGVILILKPDFLLEYLGYEPEESSAPVVGVMFAFASACLTAVVHILMRYAKHISPVLLTAYFGYVGVVFGPICAVLNGEVFLMPKGLQWVHLACLGALAAIGQMLACYGLGCTTAGKATAMSYSQSIFTHIFDVVLLQLPGDTLSTVGSCLIACWGIVAILKESFSVEPRNLHTK